MYLNRSRLIFFHAGHGEAAKNVVHVAEEAPQVLGVVGLDAQPTLRSELHASRSREHAAPEAAAAGQRALQDLQLVITRRLHL